jgi:hypothetical protein
MQLTPKFILLAIAFAYGGTAVSAVPVRESSVVARSAAYDDLNARVIDDTELFVRESCISPSPPPGDSNTGADLLVSPFATLRNFNRLTKCFLAIDIWPTQAREPKGPKQEVTPILPEKSFR